MVEKLAPFIRAHANTDLTYTVKDERRIPGFCGATKYESFLSFIPQPARIEEGATSGTHEQQKLLPGEACFWAPQDNKASLNGPITIQMLHCWYNPALHLFSGHKVCGPTALQGHAQVDVFGWGLTYVALEKFVSEHPLFAVALVYAALSFFVALILSSVMILK